MSLEELVRRIRHGDKNAIKELVAAYGSAVYQRAFERTQDKELAREAARQTFGQFVAIVQQQSDEDGWSLWFGDLIERNITAYTQIGVDMRYIETELEHELYDSNTAPAAKPQQQQQRAQQSAAASTFSESFEQEEPPAKPAQDKGAHSSGRSLRDEIFSDAQDPRKHRRPGQGLAVVLLVIICLLLVWVVCGVAMTMKWIPYYDLGYSWFNASVFRLF